ncbi:olfactomedin-4-like [Rana temporaria]|uniref:olfactomedin-4-like n=1 Tax=Rana temporaria TaxID=8407 RepID=UPI001AACB9A8|nr:olfactomedin-4-like [Rana temporaria]
MRSNGVVFRIYIMGQQKLISTNVQRGTMYTFFILLLTIWQTQAVTLMQSFISETGSGLLDENGVCYCTVNLPDTTFPVDRFEKLEIANHNLTITVEKEITKIYIYQSTLTRYVAQMKNLTKRVEIMESGGVSYTELEFELIKLEIKEMESLILQLKVSFNGSNVIIDTLYKEIHNISIMVNQLEIYDKNNVLVIRREIESLKKRLEDCENNTKPDYPSLPPPTYGTCDHGHIVNISKPYLVQQNIYGASYKWGGWGKDSLLGADQNTFWAAPLMTDERSMNVVFTYASYNDLLLYKQAVTKSLSNYGQGGGMIMYNNIMYYNCHNSNNLCKYNMKTDVIERLPLRDATYNNRFSYASTPWQDIDLAADEEGLWVIYATEQKGGNILISKLDANTLDVRQTWSTSLYKPGVSNAFMVCGVLYATRIHRTNVEEIFYMYDTKTGKEAHLSVYIEKMKDTMHSLSYNPNDHKLYMYSDGFLFTYYVTFMSKKK